MLSRVAAAAIVILAGLLVWTGATTSTGQSILRPAGQAAAATGRALGGVLGGINLGLGGLGGHTRLVLAVLVGLAIFGLVMMLAPPTRSGRNSVLVGIGAAVAAVLLYQSSILGTAT